MLRKSINSLLIIIFVFSSVGYSVSMHYCGSIKISSSIGMQAKSCCGDESGTCCHDETRHYQLKDSFVGSSQDISDQSKSISKLIIVAKMISQPDIDNIVYSEIQFIAESPPPSSLNKHLSSLQTYLL